MPTRKAEAVWEGDLMSGRGSLKVESGVLDAPYSFATRMRDERGTNPEELIGAAHAGCFSMALAAALTRAGHKPQRIATSAAVQFEKVGEGFKITTIALRTRMKIDGVDDAEARRFADDAKRNCPVSQALAGVQITLDAALET